MSAVPKFPSLGWIPCINGDLIYDLVCAGYTGVECSDSLCVYSPGNSCGSRKEQIIYTSLIDNNDFSVTDSHPEYSQYVRVFFVLEKDLESGCLNGHFFMFALKPAFSEKHKAPTRTSSGFYSTFHSKLLDEVTKLEETVQEEYSESPKVEGALVENRKTKKPLDLSDLYKVLNMNNGKLLNVGEKNSQSECSDNDSFACIYSEIKVNRNGFFEGAAPVRYIASSGGYLKPHDQMKDVDAQNLSSEIYIRVKNVFHKHHHHSHACDDVLSSAYLKSDGLYGKKRAFEKILRNLKRSVAHDRRELIDHNFTSVESAKIIGVCEYGKSFLNILKRDYLDVIQYEKNKSYGKPVKGAREKALQWIDAEMNFFDGVINSVKAHMLGNKGFFPAQKNVALIPYLNALLILVPLLTVIWLTLNIFFSPDYIRDNITFISEMSGDTKECIVLSLIFLFVLYAERVTYYRYGVKNGLLQVITRIIVLFFRKTIVSKVLNHSVRLTFSDESNPSFMSRLHLHVFLLFEYFRKRFFYQNTKGRSFFISGVISVVFVIIFLVLSWYSA